MGCGQAKNIERQFINRLLLCIIFVLQIVGLPSVSQRQNNPHKVVFINQGSLALKKRVEMINSAEKLIELETFIFSRGLGTDMLLLALAQKAQEGVKVRILIDNYMFIKDREDKQLINNFAALPNVELKFYNPQKRHLQHRDHRKILCIDEGKKGCMLGGRNLADEYWAMSHKFHHFDRDVFILGDINQEIHLSFESFWRSCLSVQANLNKQKVNKTFFCSNAAETERNLQLLNQVSENDDPIFASIQGQCQELSFVTDKPMFNGKTANSLVEAINKAQAEIYIESPTWILQNTRLGEALRVALKRKVEITASTMGGDADNWLVSIFNIDDVKKYSGLGLEIYAQSYVKLSEQQHSFFKPEFAQTPFLMHSKLILIDPKTDNSQIIIGSYNFDPRSQNLNAELMLFCKPDSVTALKLLESHNLWKSFSEKVDCKGCGYYGASSGKKKKTLKRKIVKTVMNPFKFLL